MKNISIRLDEEQLHKIKELGKKEHRDRSTIFREIVEEGLKKIHLENAIQSYIRGEASTWKAAELGGVSLRQMNQELSSRGIDLHYTTESLREDLE